MKATSAVSGRRRLLDHSLLVLGSGALATAMAVIALGPGVSSASSHREAPLIAGDPRADNTDVYAFTRPDKSDTVTLVANRIPFEEPNGGPSFTTSDRCCAGSAWRPRQSGGVSDDGRV